MGLVRRFFRKIQRKRGSKVVVYLQKASIWKRISAFLFDMILFSILAVGIAFLISKITSYDSHYDTLISSYEKYSRIYGIDFDISLDEYNSLTPEQISLYDQASQAMTADPEANKAYSVIINLSLVIVSLSLLISFIIFDIVIPIIFKNGQTLGKKIFSLGVMTKEGIRLPNLLLTARTVLGKFTIETMVPAFIILMIVFQRAGLLEAAILIGLPIFQIVLMIASRQNLAIHDLIAGTVVIDFPSQRIFESREELIAFQEERARQKAEQQSY